MKKFFLILLSILTLFCIGILFLPSIASTRFGTSLLKHYIEKKYDGDASIEDLSLSWLGPQEIKGVNFENEDLNLSFDALSADLPLWKLFRLTKLHVEALFRLNGQFDIRYLNAHLKKENIHVRDLNASIHTKKPSKTSDVAIDAKIHEPGKDPGRVNIVGRTKNPFSKEGITSDLTVRIQNFPPFLWDLVFKSEDNFFSSLFGNNLSLVSQIDLEKGNGSISFDINSPNLQSNILSSLIDHTLYLQEDVKATFQLNETLSQNLLKEINPFFLTGIEGLNPIRLHIPKQGFKIPLFPFQKEKMTMKNALLNMGRVRCKNGGALLLTISLMKWKRFQRIEEMVVWFTPIRFSIQEGRLETGRMDFLVADTLHFCSWGDIDLMNHQIEMTLGLTKQAINQMFTLKNVPGNYVLHIPIRGTTSDPDIDLGKGAAKLTALLAGKLVGGPFGTMIGSIGSQNEEETPPPEFSYPWR